MKIDIFQILPLTGHWTTNAVLIQTSVIEGSFVMKLFTNRLSFVLRSFDD
eukprot:UN11891